MPSVDAKKQSSSITGTQN